MRPQAISLGVASGVDAPFLDHSDQAGAQTVACGEGEATLSKQEKNTRQMSTETYNILLASLAQRQGIPLGDILSKSLRLGRSLTAQTAQSHVYLRSFGVDSGVDAPLPMRLL